jgi:hypothetical protein
VKDHREGMFEHIRRNGLADYGLLSRLLFYAEKRRKHHPIMSELGRIGGTENVELRSCEVTAPWHIQHMLL